MTEATDGQSCFVKTPLALDVNGVLRSLESHSTYGILETCDAQLLELFSREGIEFELLWMPERPRKGANTKDKVAVWATLYGPLDLAPDLCEALQKLHLYLQDPIHALRDSAYFNPQRFFNEPGTRTTNFNATPSNCEQISVVIDEHLVATDLLDNLIADSTLHETPGSPYLLTELKK